jgi:hypothetical protein
VTLPFLPHGPRRHLAELAVNRRDQSLGGFLIPRAQLPQQLRHIAGLVGHRPPGGDDYTDFAVAALQALNCHFWNGKLPR